MSLFNKLIDRRIAAYQRELIEIHYAEVENMYRQMRGWRHDYRSHIQLLKAHAAQKDWEAVKAYLDELETDLAAVDMVVKTGNPMADAILNSKISLARAKHIRVQADASVPVVLALSELDLCVILGNLFDNAIEASLALPEEGRLIRVYIDMKGSQLYRRRQAGQAGRPLRHHQGGGPRLRPGAHRYHCGAFGRLAQPEQRGRRVYHRNPAAGGMTICGGARCAALHSICGRRLQFSPQNAQFSPRFTWPGAFVL